MITDKWARRYLELAKHVSNWSKDPSTKTGAVITSPTNMIISLGYNGFPRGTKDTDTLYRHRETKYERILHSEVNAVLSAKVDLKNCTIYCYPLMPCARCAAQIIQAGISTVVFPYSQNTEVLERFKQSHEHAIDMFKEANISLICYDLEES